MSVDRKIWAAAYVLFALAAILVPIVVYMAVTWRGCEVEAYVNKASGGMESVNVETPKEVAFRIETDAENVINYKWDFGDGTTITTTEPQAAYHYEVPGTYLVGAGFVAERGGVASIAPSCKEAKVTVSHPN